MGGRESDRGREGRRKRAALPPANRGERTLQVKLFASIAALGLISMVVLVETSIRTHRTQVFEAIVRDGIRQVMSLPLEARKGMLTADEDAFQEFASQILRSPNVDFVRMGGSRQGDSWVATRDTLAANALWNDGDEARARSYRVARRVGGRVVEIAIPLTQLAMLDRSRVGETRLSNPRAATLWVGIDGAEAQAAIEAATRRTRDAQAVVALLLLLGIWILTRRALRPIEMLIEDAERVAYGGAPEEIHPPNSAEARRLSRALSLLATRGKRPRKTSPTHRESRGDRTENPSRPREPETLAGNYSALRHPDRATRDEGLDAGSIPVRPYRVLVAEDNPVNRSVAIDMLEDLGCLVDCASDGVECLARFDPDAFDLVFMDIQMPKMDGLEATRKIRGLESECGAEPTPIIALTAHSQDSDRTACRRAGMNAHIAKPFEPRDLENALRDWGGSAKSVPITRAESPRSERSIRTDASSRPGTSLAEEREVIDRDLFESTLESCGEDEAFRLELVAAFVNRIQELSTECSEAISEMDRRRVESCAHEIKSSSGQIGATRLQQVAARLEALVADEGANLSPLGAAVVAEIEIACSAISELESRPEGGG